MAISSMDLNGSIKNINKNIDFYKTLKSPMKSTKVQKRGQIAATRQGVWVHVLGSLVTVQAVASEKKSPHGTKITGDNGDMAILWELVISGI